MLIYIYIFFSQKRGENNTNGNHLIQSSSLLKDRKSWSRKSENLAKKEADRKQRRKITIAGAGSTSGSVCIYCGHRSVSKAYSPERNRCRREKEGLRAKRKRKAFVAVGNERGIERRGRGWVAGRWWGILRILDPAPSLDPWISLGATVYSDRLLSLSRPFRHLDRFKCFVRESDSNHRRAKRYELVFARLVLFTGDSATGLEQKRFDNGCRCKYCNARGECNCVMEERRNVMVDRERSCVFSIGSFCYSNVRLIWMLPASRFLCPVL